MLLSTRNPGDHVGSTQAALGVFVSALIKKRKPQRGPLRVIVKSGVWRSSGVPDRLIGNLFSILEPDVVYDQFQLSEPPDSPPAFLSVFKQFEHHRQGRVS